MPKHFPTTKRFMSLIRKLNRWGFRRCKLESQVLSYQHPDFQRDNPELLSLIQYEKRERSESRPTAQQYITVSDPLEASRTPASEALPTDSQQASSVQESPHLADPQTRTHATLWQVQSPPEQSSLIRHLLQFRQQSPAPFLGSVRQGSELVLRNRTAAFPSAQLYNQATGGLPLFPSQTSHGHLLSWQDRNNAALSVLDSHVMLPSVQPNMDVLLGTQRHDVLRAQLLANLSAQASRAVQNSASMGVQGTGNLALDSSFLSGTGTSALRSRSLEPLPLARGLGALNIGHAIDQTVQSLVPLLASSSQGEHRSDRGTDEEDHPRGRRFPG